MNKKGQLFGKEITLWFVRIAFLIAIAIVVIFIVASYTSSEVDVSSLKFDVISDRILFSQTCFSYGDERYYPGIIDFNKFTEERLNNCISYDKIGQGILLEITDLENNKIASIKNNNGLVEKQPFCGIKEKPFTCKNKEEYILLFKDNSFIPAILNIEVLTPHV